MRTDCKWVISVYVYIYICAYRNHTHTHIHVYIYIHIYINICLFALISQPLPTIVCEWSQQMFRLIRLEVWSREELTPWLHKACWTDHYQDIDKKTLSCFIHCWNKGLPPFGEMWWLLNAIKFLRSGAGTEGTSSEHLRCPFCHAFLVCRSQFRMHLKPEEWRGHFTALHALHSCFIPLPLTTLRSQNTIWPWLRRSRSSLDQACLQGPAWKLLFKSQVQLTSLKNYSFWARLQQTSSSFLISLKSTISLIGINGWDSNHQKGVVYGIAIPTFFHTPCRTRRSVSSTVSCGSRLPQNATSWDMQGPGLSRLSGLPLTTSNILEHCRILYDIIRIISHYTILYDIIVCYTILY